MEEGRSTHLYGTFVNTCGFPLPGVMSECMLQLRLSNSRSQTMHREELLRLNSRGESVAGAGASATINQSCCFLISTESFIDISVVNHNTLMSHSMIGSARVGLVKVLQSGMETLEVHITDKKSYGAGTVEIRLELESVRRELPSPHRTEDSICACEHNHLFFRVCRQVHQHPIRKQAPFQMGIQSLATCQMFLQPQIDCLYMPCQHCPDRCPCHLHHC